MIRIFTLFLLILSFCLSILSSCNNTPAPCPACPVVIDSTRYIIKLIKELEVEIPIPVETDTFIKKVKADEQVKQQILDFGAKLTQNPKYKILLEEIEKEELILRVEGYTIPSERPDINELISEACGNYGADILKQQYKLKAVGVPMGSSGLGQYGNKARIRICFF